MCGDKDFDETENGADNFTGRRRHQQAHVVDQQLSQVVWEQVLELVEDSGNCLQTKRKDL